MSTSTSPEVAVGKNDQPSGELSDLKKIIHNSHKINDQAFRIYVEKKVKKIGIDGERLLGEFICSENIDFSARLDLIRVAGYLRTPALLAYLKKNIDKKNNISILKESIIAISKYNSIRSINILNSSLEKVGNTLLIKKINEEIVKIKQNNPIFGLLKRFLDGEKDYKKFRITVNILKEMMTASDSELFIKYLSDESKRISEGAFEILSVKGDESIHSAMNNYFNRSIIEENCKTLPECPEIFKPSSYYKSYFQRYPELTIIYTEEIKKTFESISDPEIRNNLISIIALSNKDEDIEYAKEKYSQNINLQDEIIGQFSKNSKAVDFLYDRYISDEKKQVNIIKALLNTKKGTEYFYNRFFTEKSEIQDIIIRYIFIVDHQKRSLFLDKIFNSSLFNIKRSVLNRILEFSDPSLKEILFDERHDKEFFSIEKEYISALERSFPVSLINKLLSKISTASFSLSKIKRFLALIQKIQKLEPVLIFKNEKLLYSFVDSIISKNSIEINLNVLDIMSDLNIPDLMTYRIIKDSLDHFYLKRGNKITPKEINKIHKIRKVYANYFSSLKIKDEFINELKRILSKNPIDFATLKHFVNSSNMAITFSIKGYIQTLIENIKLSKPEDKVKWQEFLRHYPFINNIIMDLLNNGELISDESLEKIKQKLRIVISFNEQELSALFYDQLTLLFSGYIIETDPDKLKTNDILLCDVTKLKSHIENNTLNTSNIFLFLNDMNEHSSFKKYNPSFFIKPYSLKKVVNQLYKTLFFINIDPEKLWKT